MMASTFTPLRSVALPAEFADDWAGIPGFQTPRRAVHCLPANRFTHDY